MDMSQGTMSLTFTESVSLDSFRVIALTLQSSSSIASPFFASYSLMDKLNVMGTVQNTVITFTLINDDLNRIKQLVPLATSAQTTFLSITAQAIADMALIPNQVVPILPTAAKPVAAFTADTVRPNFVGFDVDMSSEQLVLTFDETVNASSLQPTSITLLNAASASANRTFTLTGGSVLTTNDVTVRVQLVHTDVNAVTKLRQLFTSGDMSYVSMTWSAITDMAGNAVNAVGAGSALRVSGFTSDSVRPQLVSFSISMNGNGSMSLTFDETVMVSSFDPSKITLQNSAMGGAATFRSYTLTGGTFSTAATFDSTVLTFIPLKADLDAVKLLIYLAVSASSTYINFTSAMVSDMTGANSVVPITLGPVNSFVQDTTAPWLVSFDLNCNQANNTGVLRLSFSEPVNASSFSLTKLVLQDAAQSTVQVRLAPSGVDQIGGSHYTVVSDRSATEMFVWVTVTDMNAMKQTGLVSLQAATTFLVIDATLVYDMIGNAMTPIVNGNARRVSTLVIDRQLPVLQSYDIDMNAGQLVLTFDEAVNRSTLVVSRLGLQDAPRV